VRIAGRKDTPGRPFLYETTRDFLVAFGLRDLTDLPKPEGELVIPDTESAEASAQGELDKELAAATDPSQQDPGPGGAELAPRG
jgi:segregation and condensation protein B